MQHQQWLARRELRGSLYGRAGLRQDVSVHELQPLGRVVTVDLLHIELAHEVDRFPCDHLAGDHDRETRRIRNDKVGGDEIRPLFQSTVDFGIGKTDMLTMGSIVGCVESGTDIALVGPPARIRPERLMEMREIRQVWHIGHETFHSRIECLPDVGSALGQTSVDFAADLHQHADQVRDVAAGIVDVGLKKDRVSRRLVELDVVLRGEQVLERRAVHSNAQFVFGSR